MKKFLLSIFAVLFAFAGVQAQVWTKVTDASTLQAGDKIVIVAKDYNIAMSKTQNNNNRGQQTVNKSGNEVSWTSGVQEFELKTGTKSNTFAFYTGSGYLYAASSSSNYLRTQETLNDNASWTISIEDGTATVKAQGTYTRNVMQYNQSSSLFACYSSASQKAICIYKYTEKADTYVEAPRFSGDETFVSSYDVVITAAAGKVYYSYSEDGEFVEYAGAITITDDTTIYAKAVNGENESDVVSKTYTRVAATPDVTFDGDGKFDNKLVVTITAVNATAYYTLDGKNPTAESTEYTEPLTIKADATLKVIAIEEGGYESSIVENKFQLQVATSSGNAETATLVTDVEELEVGNQIIIVATDSKVALSTTQNSKNRGQIFAERTADKSVVTLNSDVQVITLEEGKQTGTFAFNVGGGYLYAASSSGNYLRTKTTLDDNGSWKIEISESGVATIKAQGGYTRNWLRYNEQSSLFSCYGSGQQDLSIYKVDVAAVADYVLNVTEAGWATMYLGYNVIIPEDVNCYVIGEIDGAVVNLNQVEGILPANTAVIVEAEEGEYTFEVTEETSTVENVMEGTLKNEYITKEAYVLGIVDGVVGLYEAKMAGGVWLNNANKAYLPATAANGAASYSFRFGEGTTGVENVEVENEVKAIFDLAGRRVEEITAPGLYIVGGKKTLVK